MDEQLTDKERAWIRRLNRAITAMPKSLWMQPDPEYPNRMNIGKGIPTHTDGTTYGPWGATGSFSANDETLYVDWVEFPGYEKVNHKTTGL